MGGSPLSGILRLLSGISGFPWVSAGFCGFLRVSAGFCGFLMYFIYKLDMGFSGFLRVSPGFARPPSSPRAALQSAEQWQADLQITNMVSAWFQLVPACLPIGPLWQGNMPRSEGISCSICSFSPLIAARCSLLLSALVSARDWQNSLKELIDQRGLACY